jgi:hypothetical protein
MVDDASVLLGVSPLWNWIFCFPFLNLSCDYFPGKAHHHPQLSEVPYTLSPHSLNLRDPVSPQIGLLGGPWEVISLCFCLLGQAWNPTQVPTSLMSSAPFPSLVPAPHWVLLCIWGPHPNLLGEQMLLHIEVSVGAWWDLPAIQGMHPGDKGGDNSPSPQSQMSPQEMLWEVASWDVGQWGSLAGSNASLCQHRPSGLMSKGWDSRTKGSHLMYLFKQVTEAIKFKKQGLIHIWLHAIL